MLLLAEMYDSHWQATVNGLSRPVMPANYLLRAVLVPAGRSKVVFEYVDPWFRRGAIISVASLLATVVVIGVSHWRVRHVEQEVQIADRPSCEPHSTPHEISSEEPALSVSAQIARWRQGALLPRARP